MRKVLLSLYPLVASFGYLVLPLKELSSEAKTELHCKGKKNLVIFKDNDPFPKKGTVKTYGVLSVKTI